MEHIIIWEGPGWYADFGRTRAGESYTEGRRIATCDEYGPDGLDVETDEPIWNSPCSRERGTPYIVKSRPRNGVRVTIIDDSTLAIPGEHPYRRVLMLTESGRRLVAAVEANDWAQLEGMLD